MVVARSATCPALAERRESAAPSGFRLQPQRSVPAGRAPAGDLRPSTAPQPPKAPGAPQLLPPRPGSSACRSRARRAPPCLAASQSSVLASELSRPSSRSRAARAPQKEVSLDFLSPAAVSAWDQASFELSGTPGSPSATSRLRSAAAVGGGGPLELPGGGLLLGTPASATFQANLLSEQRSTQIEAAMQQSPPVQRRPGDAALPLAGAAAPPQGPSFEDDLRAFEAAAVELRRRLLLDHLSLENQEEAEQRRQEAERRRQQEERKKQLVEKLRNAMTPKKRVDMRVKELTESGWDLEMSGLTIPMQGFRGAAAAGGRAEHVEVVNVTALQGRCLCLGAGSTGGQVDRILRQRSQERRWEARARETGRRAVDHVALNKAEGSIKKARSDRIGEMAGKAKAMQGEASERRRRRAIQEVQSQLKATSLSRVAPTESTGRGLSPARDASPQARQDAGPGRLLSDAPVIPEQASRRSSASSPLAAELLHPARRPSRRSSLASLPSAQRRGSLASALGSSRRGSVASSGGGSPHHGRGRRRASAVGRLETRAEHRNPGRLGRLGLATRGVFFLASLLNVVRERRQAADTVQHFCRHLAQMNNLAQGVNSLMRRLRRLQFHVRQFFARKAAWSERAAGVWEKAEDEYLERTVGLSSQLRAQQGQAGVPAARAPTPARGSPAARGTLQQPRGTASWMEDVEKLVAEKADWKAFRIPAAHRKVALGRWYMSRVRAVVASQQRWNMLIEAVCASEASLRSWLEICNISSPRLAATTKSMQELEMERFRYLLEKSRLEDFVAFGEQDALALIHAAARELRESPGLALQRHPANRDSASGTPAPPSLRKQTARGPGSLGGSRPPPSMVGPRASSASQLRRPTVETREQKDAGARDVEALFHRFNGWAPDDAPGGGAPAAAQPFLPAGGPFAD